MRRRRLVALAILVTALLVGVLWWELRPGAGPPDPSVIVLGEGDAQALRDAFNAHPERTRVLALVSPT